MGLLSYVVYLRIKSLNCYPQCLKSVTMTDTTVHVKETSATMAAFSAQLTTVWGMTIDTAVEKRANNTAVPSGQSKCLMLILE